MEAKFEMEKKKMEQKR